MSALDTPMPHPPTPRHPVPRPALAALACVATLICLVATDAAAAPAVSTVSAVSATSGPAARAAVPAPALAKQAERGRYLVNAGGCHDCHTPMKLGPQGPEPDMSRALSGHPEGLVVTPLPQLPPGGVWMMSSSATNTAHAGPWGVSFAANLTPDADTGLGPWSQRNFIDTIKTGRHMGRGRPVLPPMPIPAYRNFTESDLAAIYAYLRTVPAQKNRVPDPLPPAAPPQAAVPSK